MSTHLVIPDPHAHYQHDNRRAIWLGNLIRDVKPDVVINLGDTADMPSLSGYDKGRKTFQGRTYAADIAAANDFEEKLWSTVRKGKKKMPRRVTLIGNHEQRIERAIQMQPELDGAIGYGDLQLDRYYDEVIGYDGTTPGVCEIDGVHYAHYFISGLLGKPIGGEHSAHALITKGGVSCTQGHSHLFDMCVRTRADGRKIIGLVAGVYQDYDAEWAGGANALWSPGVVIKRGVEDGLYDLEWVSLDRIRKEYGR